MKLRTAALVLALAWPGLALGQAHPGVGTPNFASMSADGAIAAGGAVTAGGLLSGLTLGVGGTGPVTGFGSGIGQALGPLIDLGGIATLNTTGKLIFNAGAPSTAGGTDFFFRRDGSSLTGGSNLLNLFVNVTQSVGATDDSRNWAFSSVIQTANTLQRNAVGGDFQAVRLSGNGSLFALIAESRDQSGLSSAASGSPFGEASAEFDLTSAGLDDAVNPSSFGGTGIRNFAHLVADTWGTPAPHEVAHGLWWGTSHGSYIDSVIAFDLGGGGGGAQIRNALDTRNAVTVAGSANPVSAVTMTGGHVIDFNGPTTITGAPRRYLTYNSGATKLQYLNVATEMFSVSDTGAGVLASGLQVGGQITSALSNAVGATVTNLFGTQYNLDNANAAAGSITNYYAMQCNLLTGAGSEPTNKFCLRNVDANAAIVTAGHVFIGGVGNPPANQQLFIQGPDTSAATFPLFIKALGGAIVMAVADNGAVTIGGQLALGISGTAVGTLSLVNATSGSLKLAPPAGALGTPIVTLPAVTDTLAVLGTSQTHTAVQTFSGTLNASGVLQGNGVAGVTCAPGAPTALFSASNGIVTHC